MQEPAALSKPYRGRLAPSPTGFLHLGHGCTFLTAQNRCRAEAGKLVLRNEDLDRSRCRAEFVSAMYEDLKWFGLSWDEGPEVGGPHAPYSQSERLDLYFAAFERLQQSGFVYPCSCSRQDVLRALQAPHAGEDEPIYPGTCRNGPTVPGRPLNWRFRVADGEVAGFTDGNFGKQELVCGRDFGDFVIWRHDDLPAYQLAVVVDDASMGITEVVRGGDLLKSTARQLLLYKALGSPAPSFYHCPLVNDPMGNRLAKRHDALSLRTLRSTGATPEELRQRCQQLA